MVRPLIAGVRNERSVVHPAAARRGALSATA
jgi:hypothetical protein